MKSCSLERVNEVVLQAARANLMTKQAEAEQLAAAEQQTLPSDEEAYRSEPAMLLCLCSCSRMQSFS